MELLSPDLTSRSYCDQSRIAFPLQTGQVPSARTNHSAVQLSPHQILLFGGCNAQVGLGHVWEGRRRPEAQGAELRF